MKNNVCTCTSKGGHYILVARGYNRLLSSQASYWFVESSLNSCVLLTDFTLYIIYIIATRSIFSYHPANRGHEDYVIIYKSTNNKYKIAYWLKWLSLLPVW